MHIHTNPWIQSSKEPSVLTLLILLPVVYSSFCCASTPEEPIAADEVVRLFGEHTEGVDGAAQLFFGLDAGAGESWTMPTTATMRPSSSHVAVDLQVAFGAVGADQGASAGERGRASPSRSGRPCGTCRGRPDAPCSSAHRAPAAWWGRGRECGRGRATSSACRPTSSSGTRPYRPCAPTARRVPSSTERRLSASSCEKIRIVGELRKQHVVLRPQPPAGFSGLCGLR